MKRLFEKKEWLEKLVQGQLVSTIYTHGPIAGVFVLSASKRICGALRGAITMSELSEHPACRAKIEALEKQVESLKGQVSHWRNVAKSNQELEIS